MSLVGPFSPPFPRHVCTRTLLVSVWVEGSAFTNWLHDKNACSFFETGVQRPLILTTYSSSHLSDFSMQTEFVFCIVHFSLYVIYFVVKREIPEHDSALTCDSVGIEAGSSNP